jgi:hypothetical protein
MSDLAAAQIHGVSIVQREPLFVKSEAATLERLTSQEAARSSPTCWTSQRESPYTRLDPLLSPGDASSRHLVQSHCVLATTSTCANVIESATGSLLAPSTGRRTPLTRPYRQPQACTIPAARRARLRCSKGCDEQVRPTRAATNLPSWVAQRYSTRWTLTLTGPYALCSACLTMVRFSAIIPHGVIPDCRLSGLKSEDVLHIVMDCKALKQQ